MSQPLNTFSAPRDPTQASSLPHQPTRSGGSASATSTTLGERLRASRYAANMTQEELAAPTFSKSYISAVERSKMTPSIPALRLLAERLHVSLAYLLGEERQPRNLLPRKSRWRRKISLPERFDDCEELLMRGEADAALELLGDPATAAELAVEHQARWQWLYGWALLQQQREQEANDALKQGLAIAPASQDIRSEGHLYFTFAQANASRVEEATAVERAYQEASRCFEHINDQVMFVCTHEQYAAFLAARGRYEEAYEHLRQAQTASLTKNDH